jgi:aromatic-L-amino-acid decarboxylase
MHAIAAAREGVEKRIREEGMSGRPDLPLLRVYISEHAHSSIEKGRNHAWSWSARTAKDSDRQ